VRLYTLDEAQALLPEVIPVVRRVSDSIKQLRGLEAAVAADRRGASGDGNLLADAWADGGGENGLEMLRAELARGVKMLAELGIEVKDPERGLIDFYSDREGEVVYLCYLLGEPEIGYWHTLAGGFAGRQAL
jgi:hypothetical protein